MKEFSDVDLPKNIDGIDIEWGVKRVGSNYRLYIKLLKDFFERYHDSVNQIEKHILHSEIEALRRLLHTLQGVAGNVGAKQLQVASHDFMNAVNSEKPFEVSNQIKESFIEEAEITFNSINTLLMQLNLEGDHSKSSNEISKADVIDLARELLTSLDNADSEANRILGNLAPHIVSIIPETDAQIEKLRGLIEDYEFDEAKKEFNLILSSMEVLIDDK